MRWDDYVVFDPEVGAPLHTLPRAEARRAFDHLMDARESRKAMLVALLRANGVRLGDDDVGIQELNDWFRREVRGDRAVAGRLSPEWYSVVNDIGLFLGDVLIARCPSLRWEFFIRGKKNVSYQRHVIMGFRQSPDPAANLDLDRAVAIYGQRVIAGSSTDDDAFVTWLRSAAERA